MDPFQRKHQLSYKSYINRVRSLYEQPIAQTSTALILTLFTIIFFGMAAIKPTLGTVSQLINEIEEKRKIDQQITQKISALSQAQDIYLANQELLEIFNHVIPPEQNIQKLLLEVEYINQQAQVELENVRLNDVVIHGHPALDIDDSPKQEIQTPPPFPSVEFSFTSKGSYQQLRDLLNRLTQQQRLIKVKSVAFNQSQEEIDLGKLRMTIVFTTYWSDESYSTNN